MAEASNWFKWIQCFCTLDVFGGLSQHIYYYFIDTVAGGSRSGNVSPNWLCSVQCAAGMRELSVATPQGHSMIAFFATWTFQNCRESADYLHKTFVIVWNKGQSESTFVSSSDIRSSDKLAIFIASNQSAFHYSQLWLRAQTFTVLACRRSPKTMGWSVLL